MKDTECQRTEQHPSLIHLFASFLRLGTTAFGGPAMIAYIRKMAVDQKRWLDEKTARDGIALCQAIPGATAMQMSAYVGLRAKGVAGAAASFIGFGLPAFLFMTILSALYVQAHKLPAVISAFNGLQAIIVAVVANATVSFGRGSLKNWKNLLNIMIAAGMFGLGMSPILVILVAALFGLLLYPGQPSLLLASASNGSYLRKSLTLILACIISGLVLLLFVNRRLFVLAVLMFKIDLLAFGGGFSSVPLMFYEIVEVRSWLDGPTLLNGIALGQVTPGPIVITATFIGYLLYGFLGGFVATVSVFLPSFMIVITLVPHFDRIRNSPYFSRVLTGILCSFVGLLFTVTIRFALNIPWDLPRLFITLGAFIALLKKVDILWVVLIGTGISLVVL